MKGQKEFGYGVSKITNYLSITFDLAHKLQKWCVLELDLILILYRKFIFPSFLTLYLNSIKYV